MTYPASPSDAPASRVRPDGAQFWAGAVATAVVAALIALVGILICRWTLSIPILAPAGEGAWGSAHTGEYLLLAALIALVAAGLLYLLMLGTPQPRMFFGWIMGLATLAAVVYPFSTSAPMSQQGATAIVDLVLGIAVTSLLAAVAARAVRRPVARQVAQPTAPVADPRYGRRAAGRGQDYGRETYVAGQDDGTEPVYPGETYPAEPGYLGDEAYPDVHGRVPGQHRYQPAEPIDMPQRRRR